MAISIGNELPIYLCQNVICRLCGCTGNNTSFLLLKDSCYLINVIKNETNVQIEDDDILPKTVCRMCIEKVQMVQHFRSHCRQTQDVLQSMFSKTPPSNERNAMFEEWLDEEYNQYNKIKQEQTTKILNDKSYGVLYTDLDTFNDVRVSVNQEEVTKDVNTSQKILGRLKKGRVKIVGNDVSRNEEWETSNGEMFVHVTDNTQSPTIYRILTNSGQSKEPMPAVTQIKQEDLNEFNFNPNVQMAQCVHGSSNRLGHIRRGRVKVIGKEH